MNTCKNSRACRHPLRGWLAVWLLSVCLLAPGLSSAAAPLVQHGRSAYRIVLPDAASPVLTNAAGELQRFLHEMTGVRLKIVPERKAGRGPALLLGPCARTRQAGLLERAAALREDGVLICTLGRDLALLGQNERGHLYSVYELLERFWGVRFLAWDATVVPRVVRLDLPEVDHAYAPPFMYRETLYFNSYAREVAARQRLNGSATEGDAATGGKIRFFPYVHSFDDLFPEQEYFQEHPEYYGLQGGKRVAGAVHAQLCLSNPEVLRLAQEKVLRWAAEHPDTPILDVSQNDGNGACECAACAAIVAEEGGQQGPILRFVNAIAGEVGRRYPDRWVETLAYAYATAPPALTRPRSNVIIRLCHAGCYFHGFEACGLGSQHAAWLEQWSRLTRRIFIWHYGTAFNHYLAPNPNLEGLARDLKFYAGHGVNGVMVQGNYQGPGGELAELRQYLCARLLWDPSLDPKALREEFCRGYYGPAAARVLEFLDLVDAEAARPVHAFAVWEPSSVTSPEHCAGALKVLGQALAAAGAPARSNRLEKLLLPYWYVQLLHPDKYGLAPGDAPALVARVRRVCERNQIEYVLEGEKNAGAWLVAMEARYPSALAPGVVCDLLRATPLAVRHCMDWRRAEVEREGRRAATLFQHPEPADAAEADFEVALPPGRPAVLRFGTVVGAPSENGVRFAVLVGGRELWSETKTACLGAAARGPSAHESILPTANPFADHAVDLSALAGQTIRLTLQVSSLGNPVNDWAQWIEPKVMEK